MRLVVLLHKTIIIYGLSSLDDYLILVNYFSFLTKLLIIIGCGIKINTHIQGVFSPGIFYFNCTIYLNI